MFPFCSFSCTSGLAQSSHKEFLGNRNPHTFPWHVPTGSPSGKDPEHLIPAAQKQGLTVSGIIYMARHDCNSSSEKLWIPSNLPANVVENQQGFRWKSVNDLKKISQNCASKGQTSIFQLDHTSQED